MVDNDVVSFPVNLPVSELDRLNPAEIALVLHVTHDAAT